MIIDRQQEPSHKEGESMSYSNESSFLIVIYNTLNCTKTDLVGNFSNLSPKGIEALLKSMEKNGLITLAPSGITLAITLTEKGKQIAEEIKKEKRAMEKIQIVSGKFSLFFLYKKTLFLESVLCNNLLKHFWLC